MEKIRIEQFDEVYHLFQKSFIPAELRPYQQMKELFEKDMFTIYAQYEKDALLGAMIVWELKSCIYLENFAVDSQMRGKGLGSQFLKEFCYLYKDNFLFLEVEEPHDEISKRRIQFYEKWKFVLNPYHYLQPTFRGQDQPVSLTMMTYPHIMSEEQYKKVKKEIFEVVYQKGEL